MLRRAKIDELRTAVGADGLITGKGQLQTYEWALTNFPGDAGRRGAAANRRAGAGGGAAICSGQNSFCESRCSNGPQRERVSRGGRYRHQSGAHEPLLEVDFANRQVVVELGVINAHVTQRGAARGYFYATRPVFAIGVHHRRQRGGECRRRALPQIRFHDHPRSGTRCGAAVRRTGDASTAGGAMRAGMDIGIYEQRHDWPNMGPSLLIGAFLVLAVRTVKWPPRARGGTTSDRELDVEIENAIHLAGSVLSSLDFRL